MYTNVEESLKWDAAVSRLSDLLTGKSEVHPNVKLIQQDNQRFAKDIEYLFTRVD